jgi:hypothetical protein
MSLQRFTISHMSDLAKVIHSTIVLQRFLGVVVVPWYLLYRVRLGE